MSVKKAEKTDRGKIRQTIALDKLPEKCKQPKLPKRARLKVIGGRPYFYSVEYIYDKETKECKQKQKYLGKTLPPGFRLK